MLEDEEAAAVANEEGRAGDDEAAAEARHEPSPAAAQIVEPLRVFIAHGKNMEIVEQVQTMLELYDIESEVAEREEATAIPVPEKVFDAMRRCRAGIIGVSVEGDTEGDHTVTKTC